jgi:hypothetical protein
MGFPPPSATPPPCPGRTIPARPPHPTGSPPPRIERPLQPRSAFSWPASRVFRPRLPEVSDRGGRRRTDARVHVPQRVLHSSPLPRASEERTATKGRGRWQPVRSRDTPLRTGWEPSTHPEGIDAANREQSNAQGHPAPPQKSQLKTQSYEGGCRQHCGEIRHDDHGVPARPRVTTATTASVDPVDGKRRKWVGECRTGDRTGTNPKGRFRANLGRRSHGAPRSFRKKKNGINPRRRKSPQRRSEDHPLDLRRETKLWQPQNLAIKRSGRHKIWNCVTGQTGP